MLQAKQLKETLMFPERAQRLNAESAYVHAAVGHHRQYRFPHLPISERATPDGLLGVILVNYRTPDLTVRSLASILRQGIVTIEHIVVIDNDSRDGSIGYIRSAFPKLKVIASDTNGGFGAGVNIGLKWRHEKYVLVLNPDTYFENNSVPKVISYMTEHPDTGLAGLDLVDKDGSRQFSARRFYSLLDVVSRRIGMIGNLLRNRMDRHLMKDAWQTGKPFDAEWIMGTGFVVNRNLITALGGMDETYFLYMEDVDLCARVWNAGFRVIGVPGARLVHDHQRSSATNPFNFAARQHIVSLLKFAYRFTVPMFRQPGVEEICRSHRYEVRNASQLPGA
jgi:N-acetylglucosaminyl-diphospho-decaprenol L-rhamnosyltransferase